MKKISALIALPLGLLLFGCSQTPPKNTTSTKEEAVKPIGTCIPAVSQDGKPVQPKREGHFDSYDLQAKPFRISFSSAACNPSIAETGHGNAIVLSAMGSVFTPKGFEMAGSPADQVLPVNRNVVLSLIFDELKLHAPAVQEHKSFCSGRQQCPSLIKAYRSYWPFTAASGDKRSYAEISATFPNRLIGQPGSNKSAFAVVYTSSVDHIAPLDHLIALKAYPMKFNFR